MGELLAFSQSGLLLLPRSPLFSSRHHHLTCCSRSSLSVTTPSTYLSKRLTNVPTSYGGRKQCSWRTVAGVVSDSKVPTTFTVDSAGDGIDILPDSGGSDDNIGRAGGDGGGGGGGGNDGDNGGEESEDQSRDHGKKGGMSMSQKLTLGYAALVGIGGAMGYLKGGSQKSLIAGGVSASLLICVYTMLPSNPVLASSIGLLLSGSLLGMMGSRFKRSGKIFPTGIVTFVSLVMSGGYVHGILRSLH